MTTSSTSESSRPGQRPRNVVFLVRRAPVSSGWTSEALRVAVGMTLADGNRVTVVLLGPAVLALAPLSPEKVGAPGLREHVETLRELGVRLVAEREACARCGVAAPAAETSDRDGIAAILADAEVLQSW